MMNCTLVHLRDLPNENSILSEEGIMICAHLRFRLRTNIRQHCGRRKTIDEEIRPLSEKGRRRSRSVARRPTFSKSHDMGIARPPSQRCFCRRRQRRRSRHRAATERARDDGGVGSARGRRCAHMHDLEKSWACEV